MSGPSGPAGAPGAPSPAGPPKPVDVAAIERELAGLWRGLGPEAGAAGAADAPVVRACMSNLLIWCDTQQQALALPEEIGEIIERHPARVILLVGEASAHGGGGSVAASVTAVCHLAGAGRQICSEHVTIAADRAVVDRLPSTARSLVLGDLPTALWWATSEPPPLSGDVFLDLAAMADHVIYDSAGWVEPARGVISISDWAQSLGGRTVVSDLAWRRGKPWRRLIGQALDPQVAPGALEGIESIEIEHGPHALPQAWLTIGWLAGRLGWQPVGGEVVIGDHVTWRFASPRGPLTVTVRRFPTGPAELRSVTIAWRRGASPPGIQGRARFERVDDARITALGDSADAAQGSIVAPATPRAALVARQLPKRFRDPQFRDALALSRRMAAAIAR